MTKERIRRYLGSCVVASLLAMPAGLAMAQEAGKPMTIRLEPKALAGVDTGKAVVVKGRAGRTPQRFLLEGISYMNPVGVVLRPVEAGDEVALSITKYAWNQPLREGSTDEAPLRFLFRTEGEFQVSVSADAADTPYRLLVWVGEETQPDFAPVVVDASTFDGGGGGFPWTWAVIGLLVLAVAVMAVLMMRRKRA
ncbi:hypothetical protein [Marilutibacter aestuarii]|uniref:LPXTG cell wall anchor domain-containing protein n=1 Tax=Marilutibacter aestuarii TaxID=1706195 RepID=A0A508APV6_9GAMM|nr:hypothetical protein [Lysobacter aestuarii]TQD50973.1 hypothetical protein FKV25_02955 [Lysobacter aestuarii]